jgi:hypothetical protein
LFIVLLSIDRSINMRDNVRLFADIGENIAELRHSIATLCNMPNVSLARTFECSSSPGSTLSELFRLFASLADRRSCRLSEQRFIEHARQTIGHLTIGSDWNERHAMHFAEWIRRLQCVAVANGLSQDHVYDQVGSTANVDTSTRRLVSQLRRRSVFVDTDGQNNNALVRSARPAARTARLVRQYQRDLCQLKEYFAACCRQDGHESDACRARMTCSTFVNCLSRHSTFHRVETRLQLNGVFYRTHSALVHQGFYRPSSATIDFHGFLVCLQTISRMFAINLTTLTGDLCNSNANVRREQHVL